MASPERPSSEFDRAPKLGGEGSGESGIENHQQQISLDVFFESLAAESKKPSLLYDFEAKLQDLGYLSQLEDAGILPHMPQNPNPYNFVHEREEHLQWAVKHQEETEQFMQNVERREDVLGHIYVGVLLAALLRSN